MRLIVGTYDGGVCGWESAPSTTGGAPTFEESFAYNPHMGAVKAVAASGVREGGRDLLASGSIDETVRVYDLARGKELGSLVEHTDTVTAVDWYRHSHMLSAGLDGAICVWRASDWTCMLTLRHPGGVTSLAVHPSGRLAFTVGVDTTYRVWDIVKGNVALQRKLGFKVKKVQWSPNGERFVLVADDHVQVRSIVDDAFVCDLPHSTAVSDAVFVGNDAVATSESTSLVVRLWKLVDGLGTPHARLAAPGSRRVRALACGEEDGQPWLFSVASGGFVGVWNAGKLLSGSAQDDDEEEGAAPLCELKAKGAGSSFRATCVAVSTTVEEEPGAFYAPPPGSKRKGGTKRSAAAAAEVVATAEVAAPVKKAAPKAAPKAKAKKKKKKKKTKQ